MSNVPCSRKPGRLVLPRLAAMLMILLLLLLLFSSTTAFCGTVFDDELVAAVLCCERVNAKWTYLKAWSEWCRTRPDRDAVARGAHKLVSPLLHDAVPEAAGLHLLSQPCTTTWQLQPEVVELFVRYEWCRDLPRNHDAIVRSPFTVFAEEHPSAEDDLVDLLASLCAREWQQSAPPHDGFLSIAASVNSAGSAKAAQALLCRRHASCDELANNMFDGDLHDDL